MDLRLYIPQYNDLEFRRQMLSDPETMSFNRGKDPAPDYNPKTGCIDFPRGTWALWYGFWMDREPENFYAILADGATPVGEVSWFFDGEHYNAGIIIKSEFRRKGYCAPALRLLCARAFEDNDLPALRVSCSTASLAANKGAVSAGFRRIHKGGGRADYQITNQEYLTAKGE